MVAASPPRLTWHLRGQVRVRSQLWDPLGGRQVAPLGQAAAPPPLSAPHSLAVGAGQEAEGEQRQVELGAGAHQERPPGLGVAVPAEPQRQHVREGRPLRRGHGGAKGRVREGTASPGHSQEPCALRGGLTGGADMGTDGCGVPQVSCRTVGTGTRKAPGYGHGGAMGTPPGVASGGHQGCCRGRMEDGEREWGG